MTWQERMSRLQEPFPASEIRFLPKGVKGNRCMAIAYISARLVMDRLDEVFGIDGWQDDYQIHPDGSAQCFLSVRLDDGTWLRKVDIGSPSEQPDAGDRVKASVSDALKRTAVKFGIGRYLYRLPVMWGEYDPVKKQITNPPQLPAWALPKGQGGTASVPSYDDAPRPQKPKADPPKTGAELVERLMKKDAKLAQEGFGEAGAMFAHVLAFGVRAGFPEDMAKWPEAGISFAAAVVKEYESKVRAGEVVEPVASQPPTRPATAPISPPKSEMGKSEKLFAEFLAASNGITSMDGLTAWRASVRQQQVHMTKEQMAKLGAKREEIEKRLSQPDNQAGVPFTKAQVEARVRAMQNTDIPFGVE